MNSRTRGWTTALLALSSAGIYACVGNDPTGADQSGTPDSGSPTDEGGTVADGGGGDGASDDGGSDCPSSNQASCGGTCIDIVSNPTNCGRCDHACGAGALCSGRVCQPVFVTGNLDGGGGTIGTLTTEETDDNPAAVSPHVFWSQSGSVLQDNVTGGNRIVLSSGTPPAVTSQSIAVNGTTVYWVGPPIIGGSPMTSLYKATINGAGSQAPAGTVSSSSVTTILYDAVDSLVVGSYVPATGSAGSYKCTTTASPACSGTLSFTGVPGIDLASDGTSFYLPDSDGNTVEIATLNGQSSAGHPLGAAGSGTNLTRVFGTPTTSGHLYWSNSLTPSIWRSGFDLSAQKQIATPASAADAIAVDQANIYWTESATGTVKYTAQTGTGSTTTLVTMGATAHPMRMVRDTQFLYFVHDTAIYRVALP